MIGLSMRSADLTSVAQNSQMRIISLAEKFQSKLADDGPETERDPGPPPAMMGQYAWHLAELAPDTETEPYLEEKLSPSELSFLLRAIDFSRDENPSLQAWEESKPEEAEAFLSGLQTKLEGMRS
jgi:hypothetical protein